MMKPLRASNLARRGFTLIELVVVLILIGIMTALIIPEMKGTYEDALLRSTGRALVSALGLAHSQAVTVHQLHRVRLDRKNGRYFIERAAPQHESGGGFVPVQDIPGASGSLDARISIEIRRGSEESGAAPDAEASWASAEGARRPARDDAVAFYPDGTADPGEIVLEDRAGFRLALRINPITARVRIIEPERKALP